MVLKMDEVIRLSRRGTFGKTDDILQMVVLKGRVVFIIKFICH